uniref:Putative ribonuclease H-like domain-containing protein n=1 Tax=Tanacetum cinerariifolium TaxID=118510 RepID=A0A6L2KTQ4_TANCI|nr:putative ribonuclease H-like domain-containing protein [Tanacetum cinerariifolium]
MAPTPSSAIIQLDVDDNFVVNTTYLNMIWENKIDGYLRADPHDHIREFLAICNMFRYGETQSEAVKLSIFPFSLCDEAKTWFNELNEESITSIINLKHGKQTSYGIVYDEVFAPVARIEAIRLFLAYASFKDFVMYQMDVKSAFLYGKIEDVVYVCQPPGFEDPDFPDKVYKVEKALYGLYQAPRAWLRPIQASKHISEINMLKRQQKC